MKLLNHTIYIVNLISNDLRFESNLFNSFIKSIIFSSFIRYDMMKDKIYIFMSF